MASVVHYVAPEVEQQLAAELDETTLELLRLQQKLARLQERQNPQLLMQQRQQTMLRAGAMPLTPPGIHLPPSPLKPRAPCAAACAVEPPPGLFPPGVNLPLHPRAAAPVADVISQGICAAAKAPSCFFETEPQPAVVYASAAEFSCAEFSCQSSEMCSTADPCDSPSSPRGSPKTQGEMSRPSNSDGADTVSFLPQGIPSIGSIGHHAGLCRPCDFVGRGNSCRAEGSCGFCHLCGPAERKLHKAKQRKLMRAMCCDKKAASGACGRRAHVTDMPSNLHRAI